jgi:uncharacterized membrane protein
VLDRLRRKGLVRRERSGMTGVAGLAIWVKQG